MPTVLATREGLLGQKTASGYVIDSVVPFVALPAHEALGQFVLVSNPANGKRCIACVLDVGPWNTDDTNYVFHGARPLAESNVSISGKGTNGAGIDLGEKTWSLLGMTDNARVEWRFVSPQDLA